MEEFQYRTLVGVGKPVLRLGLAGSYGIDTEAVDEVLTETAVSYLYWTPRMGRMTPALQRALRRDRERYVVASGPATAWWASNLRRFVHKALRLLDTDYLDVLQMHALGLTSTWSEGNVAELLALRDEGKVRAVGISTHNRALAGTLAAESPLDLLMIRYNAAHCGAEQDVFPYIHGGKRSIVAYTATAWRKLLHRPRGWTGEVPTAGHCYRFCLSHSKVDVVLTGPNSGRQLRDNLQALAAGPLSEQEMTWMRDFGRAVR